MKRTAIVVLALICVSCQSPTEPPEPVTREAAVALIDAGLVDRVTTDDAGTLYVHCTDGSIRPVTDEPIPDDDGPEKGEVEVAPWPHNGWEKPTK